MRMRPERFLIVTADDFGLHESVNEAVELATRAGTLSAASLMVGAAASADAVRRARELPGLRVGLHLVLTDGMPTLPPMEIKALVDSHGHFRSRLVADAARYFLSPRARRELEAEIRAQFKAFAATGLALDHVNAHKHFHIHPTVLGLMLKVGRDFGLRAVRLPYEPAELVQPPSWLARVSCWSIAPWLRLMQRRLDRAGVMSNDHLLGIHHSGAMSETTLLESLKRLPRGVTEIYLHPATESGAAIAHSMREYRHADELAALRSPRIRAALAQARTVCGGYGDLVRFRSQRVAA
ncbi:MAG TPA: hopanoid biosynthesis-associated protein HpnK [Steroidobacteraceae bacterium]|nr:hopanoid biosynthesis-associated protein HpnK [Steroidobacteraceae bacterium]